MSLFCRPFLDLCGFYLLVLKLASFTYNPEAAPIFTAPAAPYIYDMPTVVATKTQIVQFTVFGLNGSLSCNISSTVPPSAGFECRVDTLVCACYIKPGQSWTAGTQYNLTVEAFDSADLGNSSIFHPVVINIQNVVPSFSNLPNSLSNVDADTVIPNRHNIYTARATDADGDMVFFFLYNHMDVFSINKVTGVVRAVKDLHYLTSTVIWLDVGMSDVDDINGKRMVNATLTLNIINGNHAPYISPWAGSTTAVVLESAPANTKLCTAVILDPDNDVLRYDVSVNPSTASGYFYYDKTYTCLKTSGPGILNYERLTRYLVSIQVEDKWSASSVYTCTVIVTDDNDLPVFTKPVYPVSVMEEVSVIVDPSFTCSDEDGDLFTYSFMSVNNSNWFSIDPINGEITVNSPIDRDVGDSNQIYLTVFATDSRGGRGSTQVLIKVEDINDNAPTFQKTAYQLGTTQLTGVGTIIGSIAATDIDEGINAKFVYSCGTNSNYHCLSDGSIVTTTDLSSVAYGTTMQLTCYATDLGTPAKTGTTFVDITKAKASIPTTQTSTTTTERNNWDETEFIIIFSILMAVVGLLLLCGCYFGMRMCITGYCCGGPTEDCLGYSTAEQTQWKRSNRVSYLDHEDENSVSRRNGEGVQTHRESPRLYPRAKESY